MGYEKVAPAQEGAENNDVSNPEPLNPSVTGEQT